MNRTNLRASRADHPEYKPETNISYLKTSDPT